MTDDPRGENETDDVDPSPDHFSESLREQEFGKLVHRAEALMVANNDDVEYVWSRVPSSALALVKASALNAIHTICSAELAIQNLGHIGYSRYATQRLILEGELFGTANQVNMNEMSARQLLGISQTNMAVLASLLGGERAFVHTSAIAPTLDSPRISVSDDRIKDQSNFFVLQDNLYLRHKFLVKSDLGQYVCEFTERMIETVDLETTFRATDPDVHLGVTGIGFSRGELAISLTIVHVDPTMADGERGHIKHALAMAFTIPTWPSPIRNLAEHLLYKSLTNGVSEPRVWLSGHADESFLASPSSITSLMSIGDPLAPEDDLEPPIGIIYMPFDNGDERALRILPDQALIQEPLSSSLGLEICELKPSISTAQPWLS